MVPLHGVLGLELQELRQWNEPATSETGHAVSLVGLKVCKDLWKSWSATLGVKASVASNAASVSWLCAYVQRCAEAEATEQAAETATTAVANEAVKPAEGAQQDGAAGGRGGR